MSNPTAAAASKGLEGIVAAQTRLSDVKGDIGQLIYCGYDINELAGRSPTKRSSISSITTICRTGPNSPS